MKTVGIVGLPGAGVSTVFTALTAVEGSASQRTHQAVVPVPDERLDVLGELHSSKKIVHASLRFVEAGGLVRRGARGTGALSAELLGVLRESDALLQVVRAFEGGEEPADPLREIADLDLELVLADLSSISAKIDRDGKAARAGEAEAKRMLPVLERAKEALDQGTPLRLAGVPADERKELVTLSPLTLKPVVVVANAGESGPAGELPAGAIAVAGALEAEVAGMPPEEARELLQSYGLAERGIDRVIRAVYEQLDLVTFLTAGDKESRAWEVNRGATAPEAAGVIHSDFQRGFIRAEVIAYEDLVAAGGWPQAKAKGLIRQEGKSYVVREGDVVEFRFAV
ncbi:MAG: redox-regulated ATPase YchF [Actinobacteria bacterium]|nr:MAG: redox-regulated ATPase YchF [Actinomycetota bacterium]